MSKEKETFEDFVKKYIQNKAISSTKESYAEWLRSNGIDSMGVYSDTVREIESDYLRARGEHGANAERLASIGLTASGYSDYISGLAYSDMQNKKLIARDKLKDNEAKNLSGYRDYVKDYTAKEEKAFSSAIKNIEGASIADFDKAYAYAVSTGLTDDGAKAAAKLATDSVRKKVKESVMKEILQKSLTEAQALEYALGLGLTEEDAKELSEYAKAINETVKSSDYVKSYPDFYKQDTQSK